MNNKASGAQRNGTATLSYGNKKVELPVYKATEGPDVIDIRKLYGDADLFTYDPGFTSTASCESDITFIDGDEGILQNPRRRSDLPLLGLVLENFHSLAHPVVDLASGPWQFTAVQRVDADHHDIATNAVVD